MRLLTVFDPWKNEYCTCPGKFSLSPYTGCAHKCLYCYASSYIRNFGDVRPKKYFLKRLAVELRKIPENSIIAIANSSDPYQPMEKKLNLTRDMLLLLRSFNLKINIVTKSPLLLRDLDVLRDIKNIFISFTFTCLDKKLALKLEPGVFYGPAEKLKAISALSKYVPVAARFDPLIYPLNTSNIKQTVKALKDCGAKQIITSTYKIKPDNFRRMCETFPEHAKLWKKLYLQEGERKNGYTYLNASLRQKLISEVKEAASCDKINFSSCREGFGDLNTACCDGTSLFTQSPSSE